MSDTFALDIDEYLNPISAESPAGEYLRWESEYAEIEEARHAEEDTSSQDVWQRDRKRADWEGVARLGLEFLRDKSKDLQIAAWVTEALTNVHGLRGLRDGLRLIRALQDAFWKTAHPDSGDLELREGVYEYLDGDKRLPLMVRSAPLTGGPGVERYSFWKHKESREVENLIKKDANREEIFKSEGKIRVEDFDRAVSATSRAFYEDVNARLRECLDATEALNESIRAAAHFDHPKHPGITLSATVTALLEVSKLAGQLLAKKPAPAVAPPEPEPEPEEADATFEEPELEALENESDEELATPEPVAAPPAPAPARAVSSGGSASSRGPIRSAEDAWNRIQEAAQYLRSQDPGDPAPYLVTRALAAGSLFRVQAPLASGQLPAPATKDRQNLRLILNEGRWTDLLDETERLLAQPEGKGWLDVHRFAIRALAEQGWSDAERAARAVLGAAIREYPEWPELELDDETPCAGSETRAWLTELFPAPTPPEPEPAPPAYGRIPAPAPSENPPTSSAFDDPWIRCQDLLRDGQTEAAVRLIAEAVRDARTGRERFLRTLQQAELCLLIDKPRVAAPLLERLARQIDELGLERWEDPALCVRVLAALYRILRGQSEERAQAIYERLCQLDLHQALLLAD